MNVLGEASREENEAAESLTLDLCTRSSASGQVTAVLRPLTLPHG